MIKVYKCATRGEERDRVNERHGFVLISFSGPPRVARMWHHRHHRFARRWRGTGNREDSQFNGLLGWTCGVACASTRRRSLRDIACSMVWVRCDVMRCVCTGERQRTGRGISNVSLIVEDQRLDIPHGTGPASATCLSIYQNLANFL